MPEMTIDGVVHRAASEPLRPSQDSTGHRKLTEKEMRSNSFNRNTKPDPIRVIRQAMQTNPFVRSVVEPPSMIAGMIPLYPVYGLREGRPRRASPDGSREEKLAIKIWRDYQDDCGSQQNLISRHFAAKRSTGELTQIRYTHPETKRVVYEIVQNDKSVLEYDDRKKDGSYIWHRSDNKKMDIRILPGDSRRVWNKGFMKTWDPTSTLIPLVDLIAAWELTIRALSYGVKTDILMSGVMVGPRDPTAAEGEDWTDRWFDWIHDMAQDGLMRVPFPLAMPAGLTGDFKLLEPGQTIQRGLLELEGLLSKGLARYSGIDPNLVLEGAGAASHWNGILMKRDNLQSFIWPTMKQKVLNDIEAWPFRPALAEANFQDPDDWGVDGDWQQIAIQPDQLERKMEMADKGWIAEDIPLGDVGIESSEIMLPGTPEFERWKLRKEILNNDDPRERDDRDRTDENVGVGGETNSTAPSGHESDTSTQPSPTPRAALTEYGDGPRDDEWDSWDQFGKW